MKGQTLVEFALVFSLFVFFVLGSFHLGILLGNRIMAEHAAIEAAIAGASPTLLTPPQRCTVAEDAVPWLLGHPPISTTCSADDNRIEVTVTDGSLQLIPWLPSTVEVNGRAIIRTGS
jgi:hypothetical protein